MDQSAPAEKLGSMLRTPLKSGVSQDTVPHTFFSTDSQHFWHVVRVTWYSAWGHGSKITTQDCFLSPVLWEVGKEERAPRLALSAAAGFYSLPWCRALVTVSSFPPFPLPWLPVALRRGCPVRGAEVVCTL